MIMSFMKTVISEDYAAISGDQYIHVCLSSLEATRQVKIGHNLAFSLELMCDMIWPLH